jgi:hypothetical protein
MREIDRHVAQGATAEAAGDISAAITAYAAATRIINRYGPAKAALDRIAQNTFAEAIRVRDTGDTPGAIALLVRSIELNPSSGETRAELARLLGQRSVRDLTNECLIFPDQARAEAWYRNAIQTCMDFVVYGGIDGDIYEFGVLAGWTARRFAEIMRDMHYLGDLWLFDSFEGLPRPRGEIDNQSYDVTRGIWSGEMKLPDSWIEELGTSVDEHIVQRLSLVLSADRIHVRKGYFSETLQEPLGRPAALVHLDCDLYQSTVEVLEALHQRDGLQDGTILMFDDWNCNRANPAFGQRRAFREFLDRHNSIYMTSHFMNYGFNSAAFFLHA